MLKNELYLLIHRPMFAFCKIGELFLEVPPEPQ
jgi:hypothetical protein